MRKIIILFFLTLYLISCKSSQETKNIRGFEFDDTFFRNKNDEFDAISVKLKSQEIAKSILVILDGKKMTFNKFKKYEKKIDSTYSIEIIEDEKLIHEYVRTSKFKTIILVNKKQQIN